MGEVENHKTLNGMGQGNTAEHRAMQQMAAP